MSDTAPQTETRDGRSGATVWLIAVVVLMLVFYVLSPPWIEKAVGPSVYDSRLYYSLYAPLIYLSEESPKVRAFYIWYYNLCGVS